MHIIVFVFSQTTAKNNIFTLCKRSILFEKFHILIIIYWVIWLVTQLPFSWIFTCYYSVRSIYRIKMFMFDNTSERYFSFSIVNYSVTLIIIHFKPFVFKTQRTIFKLTITITKVLIYGASIDNIFS
ncbi:hypothetical protein VO70_09600 [Aeromonas salmonicida]|nr:hypothetical protein VO70_09600 [Aeromonas salmonicida]